MTNPPIAMLAELTHRCPLSCPYCSNPQELSRRGAELSTDIWVRVFQEAAALGVLQLHLSGGEPASRRDLVDLVQAACHHGLYTNLITSGIGLTEKRLAALDEAGLDHVQLSLQGTDAGMADMIGEAGFVEHLGAAHAAAFRSKGPVLLVSFENHDLVEVQSPRAHPMGWPLVEALGWSHLSLPSTCSMKARSNQSLITRSDSNRESQSLTGRESHA